jgi:hypothetical protein
VYVQQYKLVSARPHLLGCLLVQLAPLFLQLRLAALLLSTNTLLLKLINLGGAKGVGTMKKAAE